MNIGDYKAFFQKVVELLGRDRQFKMCGGWAFIGFSTFDVRDSVYSNVRKECDYCGVKWSVNCDGRSPPEIVVFIPEQFREELLSIGVLR